MATVEVAGASWERCNVALSCPKCGKPDWCLVSVDRTACLCQRTESDRRVGEAGWWHQLTDSDDPPVLVEASAGGDQPVIGLANWVSLIAETQEHLTPARMDAMIESTGLDEDVLNQMQMGWVPQVRAYSFPMRNGAGQPIGLRLRALDGRKWAMKGSKSGIFIAGTPENDNIILIPEGPTDTAALAEVGFECWGRHSARGGLAHLQSRLSLRLRVRQDRPTIAVVGDVDKADKYGRKAGEEGAEAIASALAVSRAPVKIIYPLRGTDAREWVDWGASYSLIKSVVQSANEVPRGI